jgi:molybdate transport system substrate-binding protein
MTIDTTSAPGAKPVLRVMLSGGFAAAWKRIAPAFEPAAGCAVEAARGASIGTSPTSIPERLRRGEPVDAFVVVGEAMDDLVRDGHARGATRIDLARSLIGLAVRAGAPKPDIGTVDAFRRALLDARAIVHSESASGVYLTQVLLPRLGIADRVRDRCRMIQGEPSGRAVARGEADIAIQQVGELLPVRGIDLVGAIPAELQKVTTFCAAIATGATNVDGARALTAFLATPFAAAVMRESGMDPVRAG